MELISTQLHTFLIMAGLGFVLGLIFHLYQVFIKKMRLSKKWLPVMDISLGVLTGLIGFSVLIFTNYGDLRFFVIISILLGLLLYFYTARKLVKNR